MPDTAGPTPAAPHGLSGRIRVLIVDDVKETRDKLKNIVNNDDELTVAGEAANGLEAVEQYDRLAPDVVSMDINMPVMDGIEATARITSAAQWKCVVIASIQTDAYYLRRAVVAGASEYLVLPVDPSEYTATLKRVARQKPTTPKTPPAPAPQ